MVINIMRTKRRQQKSFLKETIGDSRTLNVISRGIALTLMFRSKRIVILIIRTKLRRK